MVQVTSPDKLIFEEAGLTKADLVGHYERVGERLLAFAAGRPLTLQRFPNGVAAKGFMQKNASDHFPGSIARFEVPKQDGGVTHYPVVDGVDDLAYLANQGTVTFHMWTSSVARPDRPDWLVLDLDPSTDDLDLVRRGVHDLRALLDEFGVDGFPLATGSSGFHVWVPLDGSLSIQDAALATRALAGLAAARHPERLTIEFLKRERTGRVFVDWLRNNPTATVVTPFSLRPKPTAPVAVPLRWDEVDSVMPDRWTLTDLGDRLDLDVTIEPQRPPVDDIVDRARSEGVDLDSPFDRFGRR
jgi:bifunctional non-homologous end joining protein LigD